MTHMLCIGMGYCARVIAGRLAAGGGWRITGTARTGQAVAQLQAESYGALVLDGGQLSSEAVTVIEDATHLLLSVPPDADRDPVLGAVAPVLERSRPSKWIGYLSTVGVYGDRGGGWVDETDLPNPTQERSIRRLAAELAWLEVGRKSGHRVHIFRLAGIYGPGRNALESLLMGEARRIVKPGQVFNRIHVDDIAQAVLASIAKPRAGAICNVADDEPAPPEEVIEHAARLLGMEPPSPVPFSQAMLSPMARSFYAENKRIRNSLLKSEFGVQLAFPSYREGLAALLPAVQARFR